MSQDAARHDRLNQDQEKDGSSRRTFVRRVARSLLGFAGVGWVLLNPDLAEAYTSCQSGNIYCNLVELIESDPPECVYDCYDKKTLVYCYTFVEVC